MRPAWRRAVSWWACGLIVLATGAVAQQAVPNVRSALFDAPQLLRDLRALSADDMEGRQFGTRGGEKARAYLLGRFKAVGLQPVGGQYLQSVTAPAQRGRAARQGANVMGRLDGQRRTGRFIVVTAHYDHVGVRNGRVYNGAGDNAPGAAALLAVAEHFRAHRPDNALVLVAFDGEEAGLLGSRTFVRAPPVDGSGLAIDINADMLGRDPNNTLFVVGVTSQPFLRPYVERVAAAAPGRLLMGHDSPRNANEEDWSERADHYSFIQAGIPALFVGVEDYPFYHQPTDDFETIEYDFYVRTVETVIALVREFDRHLDTLPGTPAAPR